VGFIHVWYGKKVVRVEVIKDFVSKISYAFLKTKNASLDTNSKSKCFFLDKNLSNPYINKGLKVIS
jgi:hypothetical protein